MLIQLLLNGLALGSVYALASLGFGLIYNCTGVFHIAHGAIYTLAAYLLYVLSKGLGFNVGLSIPLAVGSAGVAGMLVENFVYYPLSRRNASTGALLISSLGVYVLIENSIALFGGTEARVLSTGVATTYRIASASVTEFQILQIASFLLLFPCVVFLLRYTRIGKRIKAMADNPQLAVVLGMNIRRTRLFVAFLGSILAGSASCLVALDVGIDPYIGMNAFVVVAVAVIVGGLGVFESPVIGAFLLGILQNLAVWKIKACWQPMITLLVLMVFLMLRPWGLLGRRRRTEET